MIVSVASGKGGTGKTTVAVNLALSLGNVQLLDCDVEEPDCNIFLGMDLDLVEEVRLKVPKIDEEACDYCRKCAEFCQYHAIAVFKSDILFFPELCHGCGGCTLVCPRDAITEEERVIGIVEGAESDGMEFHRGVLNIGEPMATPIVMALKKRIDGGRDAILDSPPGMSCPVVETLRDSDYALLVTEPTPFGLHDLRLAVEIARELKVPCGVLINRDGIGDDGVDRFCEEEGIPILMRIPHDEMIAKSYSRGEALVNHAPEWKEKFRDLWKRIEENA